MPGKSRDQKFEIINSAKIEMNTDLKLSVYCRVDWHDDNIYWMFHDGPYYYTFCTDLHFEFMITWLARHIINEPAIILMKYI